MLKITPTFHEEVGSELADMGLVFTPPCDPTAISACWTTMESAGTVGGKDLSIVALRARPESQERRNMLHFPESHIPILMIAERAADFISMKL